MHNDVMKQIRLTAAMHDAYVAWTNAKRNNSDKAGILHDKYSDLLNQLEEYQPDPDAVF